MSYRSPFSEGSQPGGAYSGGPPARPSRQGAPPLDLDQMGPDDYFKGAGGDRYRGPPLRGEARARHGQVIDIEQEPRSSNGHAAREPAITVSDESRRPSQGPTAENPKHFADDRSPLQRLEQRLDSKLKEEKRQRALQAEQRARERAAMDQGDHLAPPQQQVRFNERSQPVQRKGPKTAMVEGEESTASHRSPLSLNPPEEGRVYGGGQGRTSGPPTNSKTMDESPSGVPKRNMSFRERAASSRRNDLPLPVGKDHDELTELSGSNAPQASGSVDRSGSNKLKKLPPTEPRYRERRGGPGAERRGDKMAVSPAAASASVEAVPQQTTGWIRQGQAQKSPYVAPRRHPQVAALAEEDVVSIKRRATDPIQNRTLDGAERDGSLITGTRDDTLLSRPNAARDQHRNVIRLEEEDEDSTRNRLPRLGITDGGHGKYAPPKYLDEWRKATVGNLSGPLLDLSDDIVLTGERDNTWWETHPSRRRASISTRPRKAEAFDGEYDETNGSYIPLDRFATKG